MHFRVCARYFYSRLDNDSKQVYREILKGWKNYSESIRITGFNGKVSFKDIVRYVYDDNPELFYVDMGSITLTYTSSVSIISAKMRYPEAQCEKMKKQISSVIEKVQRLCESCDDKEKAVHDYLANNVIYSVNPEAPETHSVVGALIGGAAVCEGYARAFKMLCDAVDIPSIFIYGNATDTKGETDSHAWNIVMRGKECYHVDVTWDSIMKKSSDVMLYYNVSDSFISKDHSWTKGIWPTCKTTSNTEKRIIHVTGKKGLRTALGELYQSREKTFILGFKEKAGSTNAVAKALRSIIASDFHELESFSVSYHNMLDCAIIHFNYRNS